MDGKLELCTCQSFFTLGKRQRIAVTALMIFMCSENIAVVLQSLLPFSLAKIPLGKYLQTLILGALLIWYYSCHIKEKAVKIRVWPLYLLIFLAAGLSLLFHMEYLSWYGNEQFGVIPTIFMLQNGIYAVLFFSMLEDKKWVLSVVAAAALANLCFYIVQFCHASIRGYWTGVDALGREVKLSYSLAFGYRVAVSATVGFFLLFFYAGKKWIPAVMTAISLLLIIRAGSRGTLLTVFAAVVAAGILKIRTLNRSTAQKWLLGGKVFGIALAGITAMFFIISKIPFLSGMSRSLDMLVSGGFLSGNGRERIWAAAVNMIKRAGLLGFGFYGDRYGLGLSRVYYGYPHSIVLELLIEFGWLLGGLLLLLLAVALIYMIRRCRDLTWHVLFLIMLSCSTKLLFSDSFWYYWPFWAMLGIIMMWSRASGLPGLVWSHRFKKDGQIQRKSDVGKDE